MNNQEGKVPNIDIDRVIADKSEKAAGLIPGFVKAYIKRIVHQDEINAFMEQAGNLRGWEFANAVLKRLSVTYSISYTDRAKIKEHGRYIFVSNHPLGGLDGLALISAFGAGNNIKFVVNDFLMYITPLSDIFVPVNKVGAMGKNYAESFNRAYESERDILYFPAGLCSRLIKGRIEDLEWKSSFVKQALRYNREIVPIYFSGKNSLFFYRLAKLRKFLGIKFNIEMLFLPDEMFKQTDSHFNIIVGEPITIEEIRKLSEMEDGTRNLKRCASKIKEIAYSLKRGK